MLEDNQTECNSSRNWDEAFHLFANAISEGNDGIKIRAAIKLAKMSRYAPEHILALTVPTLLELLQGPESQLGALVKEACAYSLKCIAPRGEGRLAELIGQLGTIPILLRLLPASEEDLKIVLLKCLLNVITFWAPNRVILASNGGLDIVLDMLNSCTDNLKLVLLEILSTLALVREVRKALCYSRRVQYLVEAARGGSLASRTRAAQAIGLLGLIKRWRRMLVSVGSVPVLMDLLRVGDPNTKLVAGNALGVIASHVDHIRPIAENGAIPLYAELLRASDPVGREIAEDVFCVLAVFEENAISITEHLVTILRGDDPGAKAAAADVIWDLSSYQNLLSILQNSGAIEVLVELLRDDNIDVKEKVSGAIAQLSNDEDGRAVLANFGAIDLLISLLDDESEELRDNVAEALVNFWSDPLLANRISCVLENPSFRRMHHRIMQTSERFW